MIEVKRKNEERFDVMLRRFNREVQQSGILSVAKEKRYFKKEDNRGKIRKSAIRKRYIQSLKRGY
ncbi:MAG: 30S ribosomal protein S21 [Patescibacteria group bacterium]